jgi:hypothetical protein
VGNARAEFATHIMQVFLTSTDGETCVPLGFVPTRTITGKEMFTCVKDWITVLSSSDKPVQLIWGATDGFRSNHTFLKLMEQWVNKNKRTYYHFFDYVHVLKNLRNTILNHLVISPDCKNGFRMTDLLMLRDRDSKIRALLKQDPNPKDKMEMKNVEQLLQKEFLDELSKHQEPALKGLHNYLSMMRKFFLIFDDTENLTLIQKNEYVYEVNKYFDELQKETIVFRLGTNLATQISVSLTSFIGLQARVTCPILTSSLGSNVCENFFSLVRQKVRYPSLWDYACYYARAKMEFVKRNLVDSVYSFSKKKHQQEVQ